VKVSIIIPVLNEERNLPRMREHLYAIQQQGHEVIIIDGGSRDHTLMLAYEITNTVIVSKPGRALQMNSGAAVASGELLLFLHADTFLPENAMQILSESFPKDRSLGDQSQKKNYWGRFNVRLSSDRLVFRLIETLMNWRSCVTSIATGDQAIFIDKNLFERVACFSEIALMEDIEMSRRLKKIAKPVCIKSQVITSSRRWEEHGVVKTVLLMWKLRLYYFFGVSPEKLQQLYSGKS